MSNVKVGMSKKGMLIALVIGVLLLGGGGAYLLWRVNQKDTVAPIDSDASETKWCYDCPYDKCRNNQGINNCKQAGMGEELVGCTMTGGGEGCCLFTEARRRECGISAYHITYTAGSGGTVSNAGQNSVSPGGSISSKATPNTGYVFDRWNDNEEKPAERTDSNIQADATYTATFKEKPEEVTFTLKYSAEALNGGVITGKLTPEANLNQTVVKGNDGKEITFTDSGDSYCKNKIVHWEVDGIKDSVTGDSRKETNVQKNMNIVGKAAYLWTRDTTTFQYFTAGHGHLQLGDGEPSETPIKLEFKKDSYCPGSLQVRAIPQEGYRFSHWNDTLKNARDTSSLATANPRTDSISTSGFVPNIAVTAVFVSSAECGDGICSPTENSTTCPLDCPLTTVCGDGICSPTENSTTCPLDCPLTTVCGDGICSADESPATCPADCSGGSGTVPDTAIFEDTEDTIIFGIVVLMIGIGWTWLSTLPKRAYSSISKASAEIISNTKVVRERDTRENRRNRLERKFK